MTDPAGTAVTAGSGTDTGTGGDGEPRSGGILAIGGFGASPGFDPATQAGSGAVGGMELAAFYDTLMRYDRETQTYVPGTAESMTPNAEADVWTMVLRPGLKFTDGTPYDAAAVKFAVDRLMTEGHSVPKGALVRLIDSIEATDDATVTFTLTDGFAGFPSVFTNAAGFIYSPTAFQAAASKEEFNLNPGGAGAGPFMFRSFNPGESMELVRNPDYWGGEVYLDGLTFTTPAGPQASIQSIETGTLQAAMIRDPQALTQITDKGFEALVMPAPAGNMINMNSGVVVKCSGGKPAGLCDGQADGTPVQTESPTTDVRVRRAVAAAVDPEVVNDRVWGGSANAGADPFAGTVADPGVPGPEHDLDEAKRLVEEVKSEGWDGSIRLVATTDPAGAAWGLAVKSQLDAAGMNVTIQPMNGTAELVNQVLILRDFDLTTYAYGMNEEGARNYLKLVGAFGGETPQFGYVNPDMVAAVESIRTAATPEETESAYRAISEIWAEDVPAFVIAEIPEAVVHSTELHGLDFIGSSIVSFHSAWLEE